MPEKEIYPLHGKFKRIGYEKMVQKVKLATAKDTTSVSYTHLDVYKRQVHDGLVPAKIAKGKTNTVAHFH